MVLAVHIADVNVLETLSIDVCTTGHPLKFLYDKLLGLRLVHAGIKGLLSLLFSVRYRCSVSVLSSYEFI